MKYLLLQYGNETALLNMPKAAAIEMHGAYMIEVPDLDAALSWAARCPATQHGAVEVHPVWM